jgi:hypothetical protein
LLFPAPFGPTRNVNGPSLTSHAARLLKFFRATLVKKVELVISGRFERREVSPDRTF